MRLNEARLAALRSRAKADLQLNRLSFGVREALLTPSWTFFPLELGTEGDDGVVAILGFTSVVPELHADLEWIGIRHQSGGVSCHASLFIGVRLNLRPEIANWFGILAREYHAFNHGYFQIEYKTASDIEKYNNRLKTVGLHCERTYSWLHEAVYPVDATPETLSILSATPPSLERFPHCWAPPGSLPNLGIFVLAENSD